MRIVDPQSAVLTNIEVLAYVTANPPRRPPNPPPNSRNWVPSPDLRDHNTVVKEIHNYISRLSPHILNYPRYTPHGFPAPTQTQTQTQTQTHNTSTLTALSESHLQSQVPPARLLAALNESTPIDDALRNLITRLQPYGLTKGEVLMIVNLGVGVQGSPGAEGEEGEEGEGDVEAGGEQAGEEGGEGEGDGDGEAGLTNGTAATGEEMDVDVDADAEAAQAEGAEGEEGGEEEVPEEDYGPLALLDTVIEERDERLSDEDVRAVLAIIRETLGSAV